MRPSTSNQRPDLPYRLRQFVGPWITRLARVIGAPDYRLRETEYVGTVDRSMDEVIEVLRSMGFTWGPVSWYHQPPVGTSPDGSWTYRRSILADRQLHVVLVARGPGRVDVYAHEEENWLRHPVLHLGELGR